jgi:hypothetical protein
VVYLETNGSLHPIKSANGECLYDPDEVHAYGASHPKKGPRFYDEGELTAVAFEMFSEGAQRREVVIKLKITCARADELWDEWCVGDFDMAARRRRERAIADATSQERRERERARQARHDRAVAAMMSVARGNVRKP